MKVIYLFIIFSCWFEDDTLVYMVHVGGREIWISHSFIIHYENNVIHISCISCVKSYLFRFKEVFNKHIFITLREYFGDYAWIICGHGYNFWWLMYVTEEVRVVSRWHSFHQL